MSADHIEGLLGARETDETRLNPKLGLIWSFTDDTTLRLAFFRTLKRQFWARQTLEPTHVGGFNQIFDDLNGTESTRYGVGLDHRFSDRLLAGVEGSRRDLRIPLAERVDGDESVYSAYLNWLPDQSTALTAQYNFEKLTTERGALPVHALETHQVPLSMRYFHPNGVFVRFQGTYVDQTISRFDDFTQHERFWNIDAAVGYRFRKRYGIVAIEVRNLLDEDFVHLNGIMPDEPRLPPFISDRAVFAKLNLWFY